MNRKNPDEKQISHQGKAEQDEPVRHKGADRTTDEEKHSGPQPEGNGATGEPAAFPRHN